MLGEHSISRLQEFLKAGKLGTIETPVGVAHQFFIALVGVVDGMEESFRIASVDRYGNAQLPAFLPHRINARIIHGDELARFVPYSKPKIFQDLESAGAALHRVMELRHHFRAEI